MFENRHGLKYRNVRVSDIQDLVEKECDELEFRGDILVDYPILNARMVVLQKKLK